VAAQRAVEAAVQDAAAAGGRVNWCTHLARFDSARVPKIGILSYVERLGNLAYSDTAFVTALIYIDRLLEADASFAVTATNVHRLFLVCAMVAEKFSNDYFYKNDYYAQVGGIRVGELHGLEIILLHSLKWRLQVFPEEYNEKLLEVMQESSESASGAASDRWHKEWVMVTPRRASSKQDPPTPTSTVSGSRVSTWTETTAPGSPASSCDDRGVVMYRSTSDPFSVGCSA
jgi:hypothetical protein